MKFAEGDEALVRHPSTTEYLKAKVLSVNRDSYRIKFDDGMEYTVHENDMRTKRSSRSATRASERIAKKSLSHSSPSRRSAKSPGRPSKLRSTKLPKVSLARIEVSTGSDERINDDKRSNRRSNLNDEDNKSTNSTTFKPYLREGGVATRRSARLQAYTLKSEADSQFIIPRNTDRAVSLPVEKKSHLLQDLNLDTRGYSVQRDQVLKSVSYEKDVKLESFVTEKQKQERYFVNDPQEWGGTFGVSILVFALPLSIILPQLFCKKNACTLGFFKISTDLKDYVSIKALLVYISYLSILSILSILPIGKLVDGAQSTIGTLQYRINGLLCATVTLIIFGGCVYGNIAVSDFILENIVQLSISGWILGISLSVILYIKGGKESLFNQNIYASTSSPLYNFWQGREINPRSGPLDFKLILLRSSIIGMVLIDLAVMVEALKDIKDLNLQNLNLTVFLATPLQIIYALEMLTLESTLLTSFEIMYEGTGYMICVAHLLYPFLSTLPTRFMLIQKKENNYISFLLLLFYIIGYIIYRRSNLQKNKFRKNPFSPAFEGFETIPTSRGKKLLAAGLWGYVRHPNYLGDIIMHWSLSGISLTSDILPYYVALCCTLALTYRAIRDNARCKLRYGYAWERYCTRVKYMILNHLF